MQGLSVVGGRSHLSVSDRGAATRFPFPDSWAKAGCVRHGFARSAASSRRAWVVTITMVSEK